MRPSSDNGTRTPRTDAAGSTASAPVMRIAAADASLTPVPARRPGARPRSLPCPCTGRAFGALALGTIARLKPCVAASFRRSSPFGTGRISPDRPTSPNAIVLSASGRSRSDDSTASSTGRSAAVSCTRMPPTTLTNTSWSPITDAAVAMQHRQQHRQAVPSRPTATRRGLDSGDASTSACTSTSSGRVPSRVTITQLPGCGALAPDRKIADGFGTSRRPLSPIANTPSSLTAPKRFLNARSTRKRDAGLALEIQHRIDHVLEHARAGDAAFLGDVADQEHRGAGFLGVAHQPRRALAHLADRAGRGGERARSTRSGSSRRRSAAAASPTACSRMRSTQVSASACRSSSGRPRRTARPATWASDSSPVTYSPGSRRRHLRQRLQQQRRLADAGIAADQHHRTLRPGRRRARGRTRRCRCDVRASFACWRTSVSAVTSGASTLPAQPLRRDAGDCRLRRGFPARSRSACSRRRSRRTGPATWRGRRRIRCRRRPCGASARTSWRRVWSSMRGWWRCRTVAGRGRSR